jgi:hypothetical protein
MTGKVEDAADLSNTIAMHLGDEVYKMGASKVSIIVPSTKMEKVYSVTIELIDGIRIEYDQFDDEDEGDL